MTRNNVLSGLNSLLITLVSTNDIYGDDPHVLPLQISPEEIWNYIWKKLTELVHTLESFFAYLVEKFDEIFPADMRSKTWGKFLTALPFVIAVLILLLCLYYCCKCCCCRGRRTRWMRAPGRSGATIPRSDFEADPRGSGATIRRSDFEADPRSYFVNLRAGRPIEENYQLK